MLFFDLIEPIIHGVGAGIKAIDVTDAIAIEADRFRDRREVIVLRNRFDAEYAARVRAMSLEPALMTSRAFILMFRRAVADSVSNIVAFEAHIVRACVFTMFSHAEEAPRFLIESICCAPLR